MTPSRPPRVFVSATTRDLGSYRAVVAAWAAERGYVAVVQDVFAARPDRVSVPQLLRDELGPCDAVVHLAGFYYGFEPADRPPDAARRSYTQLEYEFARGHHRQVFALLANAGCPFDAPGKELEEDPDKAKLQADHRARLTSGAGLYYTFADAAGLRAVLDTITIGPVVAQPRNLPFPTLGTLFKGRDAFLARLKAALTAHPGSLIAVTAAQAIHGLGGVGKTRAAVEYGWRHATDYTALLYVRADSPDALDQNLAALCGPLVLDLKEQTARELSVQLAAALQWLRANPGWFLIVDNVDTPAAAEAVARRLADLQNGHVVVTSRLSKKWKGVQSLEMDMLDPEDAAEFLLERTADERRPTPTDAADALALAETLGGLALALEQAGAFVAAHRISFADYRTRWLEQEKKVLEWCDPEESLYPVSVAVTWQTSFDQLTSEGRELLRVLSWLAPDAIPRKLAEKLNAAAGDPAVDVEAALADLRRYSLLKWDDAATAVTVHRLVQDVTRFRLSADERRRTLVRALRMVDEFVVGHPQDVRTWAGVYTPARGHLERVTTAAEQIGSPMPTPRLMGDLATYLYFRCEFTPAEKLMRQTQAVCETAYGPDHPQVATSCNNLAKLLRDTNRLAEAEPLYRRALEIDEAAYGPHHPEVATDLNNLAGLLRATNRLAEAEPLYRRALAVSEAAYGPDHPTVAIRLNNLAGLLAATSRLAEAEPLFRRALAVSEAAYGPDHPTVAIRLNNLAGLLEATSRLAEAEPLYRRALEIDEAAFGPDHPTNAIRLNNLAGLLAATGRAAEAEPLYRRALAVGEAAYGPDHPDVAIRLGNLAELLEATGRAVEAEPLYRRALAVSEAAYGPDHPQVAGCCNNLAGLLAATDRAAEAEPLYVRVIVILALFQRNTGHQHPNFEAGHGNYVGFLQRQGLTEEAIDQRLRDIAARLSSNI